MKHLLGGCVYEWIVSGSNVLNTQASVPFNNTVKVVATHILTNSYHNNTENRKNPT